MKKKMLLYAMFAIALVLFAAGCVQQTYGPVKVDFYVMSQCPYGTQAEEGVKPVLDKLGKNAQFTLNFIGDVYTEDQFAAAKVAYGENAAYLDRMCYKETDGKYYCSLHGENEVKGDIAQLCAVKYNPDKYMDMVACQNKDAANIPSNWESCAASIGLNTIGIKACYEGAEGKQLFVTSIAKAEAVQATGSPTIYLNGALYKGGRTETNFLSGFCDAFGEKKPSVCTSIPPPTKVNAIILNDKRCTECDVTQLVASLKSIFPGLETKELDYSSKEGKELYESLKLDVLPAILFDSTVKDGEGYSNVENYLQPAGDYYLLKIGAAFDPTKEICDNGVDDTGNGLVDCNDADCKDTIVCRDEKKNNLQVFIMSDCPYGKKAVEALKEVVGNFGSSITYEVHYIASETDEGFNSLHGTYESDEDIVQLCVKKYSPNQWLDYIYCRSINGIKGKDWKDCGNTAKVDIAKVEACFSGEEGKGLLREDIKIADSLGISASPTWLANNKYEFGGVDAETVKTSFCQYNTGLKGCEATLSSGTTGTTGTASGSCGS